MKLRNQIKVETKPAPPTNSPFTTHDSPLTTAVSRLTTHHSPLTSHASRLPSHPPRLTSHASRLSSHHSRRYSKSGCFFTILALIFVLMQLPSSAQTIPKRELRAAWIATVMNIDWPSQKGLGVHQQQQEYVALLDTLQLMGMNAVIVQVRPVADAFYPSSYEPWSEYLSGTQGKPSLPYYNPLNFMIGEARKRGMEFHAWFNPYRASMNANLDYADNHPIRLHPEWFVEYGGKYYYDPGHPEAQEFVLQSIMETVKHYDLDAVHFDDYFYPYRIANVDFPDSCSYQAFGSTAFETKDDWRRNNVDFFVEELSRRIRMEKAHMKFGISPFGVWRNIDKDSLGSQTQAGQTNYDDLYADVLKWLREGWIDYVTPQLYWHIGFKVADYNVLVDWWSKNTFGKHLYVGQGIYRMGGKGWEDPHEIVNQIELNRRHSTVHGSMYFSAKFFMQGKTHVRDMMRRIYPHKALVPVMNWMPGEMPPAPAIKNIRGVPLKGIRVEWEDAVPSQAAYYVVYRFESKDPVNTEDPTAMLATVPRIPYATQFFVDNDANKRTNYTYVVTGVDRLHHEGAPSQSVRIRTRGNQSKIRIEAN